jgi:hypothetical protein
MSAVCLKNAPIQGEWEGRIADGTSTIRNGTRGSMAPNWKPLSQEDLTGRWREGGG